MNGLQRLPDWRARLAAWIGSVNGLVIVPGRHDCCLFGAGAVHAQTGVDLAAPWRGRYTTFAGGRRMLRKAGWDDHIALFAHHLPEVAPLLAGEGDIAVVQTEDGPAVGVVQGAGVYVLTASGTLGLTSLTSVQRAFKVV